MRLIFDGFELDREGYQLFREGVEVGRAFYVLQRFVPCSGFFVTSCGGWSARS